ncbi:18322_t:CDS:2, partial [Gigaspora margarita]
MKFQINLPISKETMNNISFNSKFNQSCKIINYRKTLFNFQSNNDNLFQYEGYKIIERVSLSINYYYQFYKHSLLIPNEKHISLHYVQVINYYNNDPAPEVISNNESELVAELKYNFIEIQIISETIIKVQHRNLNDADEQIDNRIIEIQQEIDIVKDNIKGNYDNLEI